MGAEQLLHPGIVVDAVDDHDLRGGERLGGLGARLEQMRILVRIAEDAGHRDVVAADLAGDVAVEILGGDDLHRVGERGAAARAEAAKAAATRGLRNITVSWSKMSPLGARRPMCYVITSQSASPSPRRAAQRVLGFAAKEAS